MAREEIYSGGGHKSEPCHFILFRLGLTILVFILSWLYTKIYGHVLRVDTKCYVLETPLVLYPLDVWWNLTISHNFWCLIIIEYEQQHGWARSNQLKDKVNFLSERHQSWMFYKCYFTNKFITILHEEKITLNFYILSFFI